MAGKRRRGRGEGNVEQLPSGKWRAIVSYGTGRDGKRRRKRLGPYDTKGQALKALRHELGERDRGLTADAGGLTVGQWLDRWLSIKKSKIEPGTYRWYEHRVRLRLKPHLGELPLEQLAPLHVEEFHAKMTEEGVSPGEQRKAATTLRTALKAAQQLRLLARNPALEVEKPKHHPKEMTCWTAAEAAAFLRAAAGTTLEAYWQLALDAGMRPGEILGLHWAEVDLAAGSVFVRQSLDETEGFRLKPPKTRKGRRTIRLGQAATAALARHRERMQGLVRDVERGPVFVNTKGKWIAQSDVYSDHFLPLVRKAGVPRIRPYDLRHTSATLLLAAGVNVKVVSERLGHESIEITLKHYAHVLPSMQEHAVAVLNELFSQCPNIAPRPESEQKDIGHASDYII